MAKIAQKNTMGGLRQLEKVERVIDLGFQNPKLLRYRDFYGANTES
jgi:hypothetical protein